MAKSILSTMPAEVRVRLKLPKFDDFEAQRQFDGRLGAAFHALTKHYGLNAGPPAQPDFWPQLALKLAADFLPAFAWRREGRPNAGRRKIDDDAALTRLLELRRALP